jgi:hypothetical protein
LICPGSTLESPPEGYVEDTRAADEGTLCHSIAEDFVKTGRLRDEAAMLLSKYPESDQAYFLEISRMAADWVTDKLEEYSCQFIPLEWKIKSNVVPDHGGTIDVSMVCPELLHIVDYKFGRVAVYPEDNKQLLSYLCLARQEFGRRPLYRATIAQPTNWPPDTAEFSNDDLDRHLVDVIEASTQTHKQPGQHCEYCKLLGSCEIQARALKADLEDFPQLEPDDPEPDLDLIAKIYLVGKIADKMATNSGNILKHWHAKGVKLPRGLSVRTSHRERWTDQAEEFLKRGDCIPEGSKVKPADLWADPAPKTPAVVRSLLELTKAEMHELFGNTIELQPVRSLVIGKGGQKEFPEFDEFPT